MHQSTSPAYKYKERLRTRAAVLPARAKRKAARGRPLAGMKSPLPYARAETLVLEERLKAA